MLATPVFTLTNATTVSGSTSATLTGTLYFMAIEFETAPVVSRQEIVSNLATNTNLVNNITVSSVNTANTWMVYQGARTSSSTQGRNAYQRLTSSTNVELTRYDAASVTLFNNFTLMEFITGVVKSIQRFVVTVGAAQTTTNQTITSVDTTKSIVVFNGFCSSTVVVGNAATQSVMASLTSATNLACTVGVAGTTDVRNIAVSVIEFN
jgi:hypothetical protein